MPSTLPSTRHPVTLFLHGGPGMSAELERRRFGTSFSVHWWDQPRVAPDAAPAFEVLVDAAVHEATRLAKQLEARINLLANSFGAYVARALVGRAPDVIGKVTICGGVWDLRTAILRLASRFVTRCGDTRLESAYQRAVNEASPESCVALLATVSTMPGFLECYWAPGVREPMEAMQALAVQGRLIDWSTCQAVMTEALAVTQTPLPTPLPAAVRVLVGRYDPYFGESDVTAWQALWPGSTVAIVEAGHFPHLELPATVWMP